MKTAALFLLCAAALTAGPADDLRDGVRAAVSSFERAMERPQPAPSIRDVSNCALAKLALGDAPAGVEKLLRYGFAQQDMNPQSPDFGYVPWQVGHPEIRDANSIEFFMQPVGPILKRYGARLSPELKRDLDPHIRAAFAAMRRHKVAVGYTNIFLMKTVNLILSGEAVGDGAAAADGYRMLDEWVEYTRANGIREFASPTYYSVDLNSLNMGYLYAARPGAKERFRAILDYFWTDIAANWFAGRQTLGGAHSRDYDFLTGIGRLMLHANLEGLRDVKYTGRFDFETAYILENVVSNGYRPGAAVLRWAKEPERTVVARWDPGAGRDRYHYVTRDLSIGSANGDYNPQDKMIAAELASTKDLPAISVVPDIYDAPWGRVRSKDRSGHSKPKHIPLHPVTVQEKGTVLALLDLDPAKEDATTSLATNLVLPAAADRIVIDGEAVSAARPFTRQAGRASVVAVRERNAAFAVRIFDASGADGQSPEWLLQADAEGLKYGAMRYTAYHYRGAEKKLADRQVRAGILMVAAPCQSDADLAALVRRLREAKVESRVEGKVWTARVALSGVTLEAAQDLGTRAAVKRAVNGRDFTAEPLVANGRKVALQ